MLPVVPTNTPFTTSPLGVMITPVGIVPICPARLLGDMLPLRFWFSRDDCWYGIVLLMFLDTVSAIPMLKELSFIVGDGD